MYSWIEASTGIFRPVPPFSSLSAIPSNALYFGSILGIQRFCCKSLELFRRKEDIYNDLFGFGMIWPYYHFILNHSERRLISHNRLVGGTIILSVLYANILTWMLEETFVFCPFLLSEGQNKNNLHFLSHRILLRCDSNWIRTPRYQIFWNRLYLFDARGMNNVRYNLPPSDR